MLTLLCCCAGLLLSIQFKAGTGFLKPTFAFSDPAVVSAAIILVTAHPAARILRFIPAGALGVALGILLSILANSTFSLYAVGQKFLGLGLLIAFSAVAAAVTLNNPAAGRLLLWSYLVGVTLHASVALGVWASQSHPEGGIAGANPFYPRLSGFIEDPNAFGGLVGSAALVGLVLLRESSGASRVAVLLALAPLATATLLTYSRSAWIGVAVALLVLLYRSSMRQLAVGSGVVVLVGLAIYFVDPAILRPDTGLVERSKSIGERAAGLEAGLVDFIRSPLFGIGVGESGLRYGVIPHNTFLWLLIESGPLAPTAFLWFVWRQLRRIVSRGSHLSASELACGIGFASMFGLSLGIEALYQRQWWLFAGILVGYSLSAKRT